MTEERTLADFVRAYIDRAVNSRDPSAVDELVDPAYEGVGYGWPADRSALRAFYAAQARSRPDWRIEIQQTVEVGDCVVVRAHAHGHVVDTEDAPSSTSQWRSVEWVAAYWIRDTRITKIEVLALVEGAQR